ASASCHAITRLIAAATTSSRIPFASRNSSKSEPKLRSATLCPIELPQTPYRHFHICDRCFLRLLDKTMQEHHLLLRYRKKYPRYPASKRTANLPKARRHLAHQWHAQRPANLHFLDVHANSLALIA